MKVSTRLFWLLLALLPVIFSPLPAHAFGWPNANDSMFPPLPAAKPYINFDGKGFIIGGKRTFIAAGELQYSRTPRALWRDRMLRVKRAGYNALQTYVFWNYHEPREGEFDFSGDRDFDAYLKLAHSLGLYVVVRMGPYVNSEWDSGGLPLWLRFNKPGLLVLQDNAQFYQAVDPYFNKLVPIIARNQINHGGSVILVQMENENGTGGGTDEPTPYYKRFHTRMLALGLQVPLFFSGLNHNDHPAGDAPFDTSQRTSPWYSTEFWTGWFGLYGSPPDRAASLERATWAVIAYGGSGYSHYLMVGGTDFDAWNADVQGASYDFCAPVGQTGDLRDVYYRMKRAATFATSFPDVIENSLATADGDGVTTTNDAVHISNRKGPSGEILFLDNRSGGPATTQIKMPNGQSYPSAGPITLGPSEFMPVVRGYPLGNGVTLSLAAARILGVAAQGDTQTLVIYGKPNDPAELHFDAPGAKVAQQPSGESAALAVNGSQVTLKTKFPANVPTASTFRVGGHRVRVLAMSSDLADRTWFLEGGSVIACGPDYIGEATETGGKLQLAAERRSLTPNPHPLPFLLYREGSPVALTPVSLPTNTQASATAPTLSAWSMDASVPQAQPDYNDAGWKASPQPLAMGADGDNSAFAWYRTRVNMPSAGTYQLNMSDVGDWVTCFVNGKRQDSSTLQTRYDSPVPRQLTVKLPAGTSMLAFLTTHNGRNKLYAYYGPMDTIDAKGIAGPVTVQGGSAGSITLQGWKMRGGETPPPVNSSVWKPVSGGNAPGVPVFFRTTFNVMPPSDSGPHPILRASPVGLSRGTIWLNGHNLGRYPEKSPVDGLYMPEPYLVPGRNTLVVFDEDGRSPSQMKIVIEAAASRYGTVLKP